MRTRCAHRFAQRAKMTTFEKIRAKLRRAGELELSEWRCLEAAAELLRELDGSTRARFLQRLDDELPEITPKLRRKIHG